MYHLQYAKMSRLSSDHMGSRRTKRQTACERCRLLRQPRRRGAPGTRRTLLPRAGRGLPIRFRKRLSVSNTKTLSVSFDCGGFSGCRSVLPASADTPPFDGISTMSRDSRLVIFVAFSAMHIACEDRSTESVSTGALVVDPADEDIVRISAVHALDLPVVELRLIHSTEALPDLHLDRVAGAVFLPDSALVIGDGGSPGRPCLSVAWRAERS